MAKHHHPEVLNDFRPDVLNYLVIKLLIKLQVVYRTKRGVEEATANLLNLIFKLSKAVKHMIGSFADYTDTMRHSCI